MGVNVFIDGQAGTTGLRILDRFANRNDITLLQIDPEKRKDAAERKRLINSSDYTFLCLPEMQKISGLANKPMFTPIVDDFFNGMVVCVSVQSAIAGHSVTPEAVHAMYAEHYQGQNFVKVMPLLTSEEMTPFKLSSNDLRDTNLMQIFVFGSADQVLLCARLDNLGKGASGAAVQCLNIMMGIDETTGLL